MIKVVRGNPTPEELAAALAVVQARAAAGAGAGGAARRTPQAWSDPARLARGRAARPGPGAWARTYLPG